MRNHMVRVENEGVKLSLLYVILVFIPYCSLLYSWVPELYSFVYICAIATIISLFIIPKFFLTSQFWLAVVYMIVVFMNSNHGDEFAYSIRLMDGFIMLMSACIGYYLITHKDNLTKTWIIMVVFMTIIIQTIPSLGVARTASGSLREMMNLQYLDQTNYTWNYLYKAGLLSYDTIHAIPFFIPPIVMWLRNKELKTSWKVFFWITLLVFFVLISIYEATTVQLLFVLNLVASFLIHNTNKKKSTRRILILAIVFLPFIVSDKLQVSALQTIESVTSGELSNKAGDAVRDLQGTGGSDASVRAGLYTSSLDEFSKSPLVGTDDSYNIGGHSVIFDRLGCLGLVGIIPYILFVFFMLRLFDLKLPPNVNKWYFYISVFSFCIMLLLKNMHKIEVWLGIAVVVPALLSISERIMIKHKV